MYLVILPIVTLLRRVDYLAPEASTWPIGLAAYIGLTTLVSMLVFTYFEKPMTMLHDKFS